MKKFIAVCLILSMCFVSSVFAKGKSGGFSSSRSSSWGSKSSSSKSSWGSKSSSSKSSLGSKSSSSKSSLGSKSSSSTPSSSSFGNTKSSSTIKNSATGKTYPSRAAAISDFKSKAKTDPKIQSSMAKQYPTTYKSEPATRPAHIPATYNNYNVSYHNGGYGYYGNDGSWNMLTTYMLMDTMSDAMMYSAMSNHGYATTTVHSSGSGVFGIILVCFVIFFVIVLMGFIIK